MTTKSQNDADLEPEARKFILKNKLQLWQNTLYDAELDIKLAKRLEDKQMEKVGLERMKKAQKAVDWLVGELAKPETDS